ncbi:tetratricopeptide repeat protein [Sandaracinus amylolyticus]|uniref:tetratricopeptide repeat protein n=1 Tax=Sandaracinus amylolyticus TaxID=927083 RepID=UPI001F196902|nr:tetratricopeptide repeat protein [Sandaracinus amylolyticus]
MSERRGTLATLGALALVAVLATNESADPDLGFHLATGRAVLTTGAIPATNVLTFAEPDHPWINQQWLPATAFTLAYDGAGFAGTLLLRIALVVATAAFVLAAARRLGASPELAAAACALGAWAAAFRFVERPLLASNLALAIVLWSCAGALRSPRPLVHVAIAGLVASIAVHLHAGAIFSLIALLVLAISLALEPLAARLVGREPLPRAREGALALVVATLGAIALAAITLALYHPHGLAVLGVPLQMASDPYLGEHLIEFRPPWDQPLRVMWPYWALVITSVLVVIAAWRRAPLPLVAMIALGLAISMRHARFADLAWIFVAPSLAALASSLRVPSALAVVIAIVALVDRSAIAPPAIGPAAAVWPAPLFDAVEQQHIVGPAYVQDGWAGPFLARFWPRERVFFHPSFEAYSDSHFRLYQSIRYGEPGWDRALDDAGVQLVVMKHTSPRERAYQQGRPNLRQHLAASDAWALVAFDELGMVFVRRDGPNAAIAARSPSFVDVDRMAFTRRPRESRAGLEQIAERGPWSVRLALLLAIARADAGDDEGARALLDSAAGTTPDDPRIAAARRVIEAALSR